MARPGPRVLRRLSSPDIEWVEVEGEVVIWHAANQSLHLLDPVASLIFQLLDGTAGLDETVDDLAEHFGLPPEEIAADVAGFVDALGALGVVEDVP